jgi:hypothetical protein
MQRLYRRLNGEYDKHWGNARALLDADGAIHLRFLFASLEIGLGPEVKRRIMTSAEWSGGRTTAVQQKAPLSEPYT